MRATSLTAFNRNDKSIYNLYDRKVLWRHPRSQRGRPLQRVGRDLDHQLEIKTEQETAERQQEKDLLSPHCGKDLTPGRGPSLSQNIDSLLKPLFPQTPLRKEKEEKEMTLL